MGRLFWKFLFFFWLSQLITMLGVGMSMWLLHPDHPRNAEQPPVRGEMERPPPPPDRPRYPGDRPPRERSLLPPPMPLILGSGVSLLFAALLAWYFARPIRSLRTAFEAVAGGELTARIGSSMGNRRDELADLGADFDHMAERLQNLLEGQRRLLHDVSHELRSPLARLQAAADLMRQQPERGAEFIARIERDTERMDTLVGELLTLARLDAGMTGNLAEDVDLCEIIDNIADDAHFEAEPKRCRVETSLPNTLAVVGNHELIYRAIENVVRNALRHSPEAGRIGISAQTDRATGEVVIEISDAGKGVPQADLESIFAPFFRSEGSSGLAGSGLGLAITRRVIETHGGSVSAANRPEGGLNVTLRLPAGPHTP